MPVLCKAVENSGSQEHDGQTTAEGRRDQDRVDDTWESFDASSLKSDDKRTLLCCTARNTEIGVVMGTLTRQ